MIQEEAQDFRLYLQNQLTERCKKNPKYSLRSFAQRLDMESSALSKILRGKRRVTEKTFLKLSKILNLSPHEIAQFRQNLKQSAEYDYSPKNYQQVSLDAFNVISDWYHYAILELTTVKKFKPSEKWIAKSLGISVSEVNIAVERLKRLGFLKVNKNKWIDVSSEMTTVGNDFTHAAFRRLQKQVLEKALDALENVSYDKRDQTSLTMAICSKKVPHARERIKKFRRSLCEFLREDKKYDEVYQLSVSLYPLTEINKQRRN